MSKPLTPDQQAIIDEHKHKADMEAKPDKTKKESKRGILIKELKALAMAKGCGTSVSARRLIKGTFSRVDQREIAIAVMLASIENTIGQKRERILDRDVGPIITIAKVF